MTTILLSGKNGQVGWELQTALSRLGPVIALDRGGMDLANPDSIRRAIRDAEPQIIVNAAAYTAVDKAETEPDLAMQVNGIAPGVMAQEAKRLRAVLVHYSTDYVFDGTKKQPYVEDDPPNPLSQYGRSKLAGEQAIASSGATHLIFRTSWVYAARAHNFLRTILRLARERNELRIVNDQVGAPTWARFIAEATAQVLRQVGDGHKPIADHAGIYNLTGTGAVSWYGFASAVFAEAKAQLGVTPPKLIPITTAEYPLPARRPANSRLDNSRLVATFGLTPPPWDKMLKLCMKEIASPVTG
ncbi:MAG TPA: dTDP-4-dehydrorhamnose reductase [Burkholderiales bacterium]|nr:dTDP-4-dehydrorhamnose reductase [Burkholderiales bacterium]